MRHFPNVKLDEGEVWEIFRMIDELLYDPKESVEEEDHAVPGSWLKNPNSTILSNQNKYHLIYLVWIYLI